MNISAIALGVGLAAIAATASLANAGTTSVQCGVAKTDHNGMLALEGTITSPVAVSGEYRLAIQSSSHGGSSNISQGGAFTANANQATVLGRVMLNAGASYNVIFDITTDGKKIDCNQELASLR